MKHLIEVLNIQTNTRHFVKAEILPLNHGGQTILLARMEGTEMLAELDLQNPTAGWKVFPN